MRDKHTHNNGSSPTGQALARTIFYCGVSYAAETGQKIEGLQNIDC